MRIRCLSRSRFLPVNYFAFSQLWFPTVQDVLHADWQDVWHSPQPPFFSVFCKDFVFNVLICFMTCGLLYYFILSAQIYFSANFRGYCITELAKIKVFISYFSMFQTPDRQYDTKDWRPAVQRNGVIPEKGVVRHFDENFLFYRNILTKCTRIT